jgi:hypothetical protein
MRPLDNMTLPELRALATLVAEILAEKRRNGTRKSGIASSVPRH